jgi:ketosteroid isomerase-like protein
MSNIPAVQAIYQSFGAGDVPGILAHISEDVSWEEGRQDHGVPWLKPGRGHAQVVTFLQTLAEQLDFQHFEPINLLEGGNQVVGVVRLEATAKATGKQIVEPNEAHLWTFGPDGKVTAFCHLADTHQHWAALQP